MDLESLSVAELLERVSAKTPTPGGGTVAPLVGALAAALASMVVRYSEGRKELAAHAGDLLDAAGQLETMRRLLVELAREDAEAYTALNEALRRPKDDPARDAAVAQAADAAVTPPLATIAACAELLRLLDSLADKTNRTLRPDLSIAAVLAEAAARASRHNIAANVPLLASSRAAQHLAQADEMLRHAREYARGVGDS